MDNLGSQRGEAVRHAIRKAGAKLLFLPKYSPDLNPFERVFFQAEAWAEKGQGTHLRGCPRGHRRTPPGLHP